MQTIFILPFKNPDMLWILVPLWLSWFFAEFFQEKLGTSFGNAISNAVVVLWAGIDCVRQTLRFIGDGTVFLKGDIIIRFILCGLLIAYGIVIIIYGTQVKKKVKLFGRIRDVTYAFAILVPVLYNVIPFTTELILSAILFFPLFYYGIELFDIRTPTPKAVRADVEDDEQLKIPSETSDDISGTADKKETKNKDYSYQSGYNNTNKHDKKPPNSGSTTNYWNN